MTDTRDHGKDRVRRMKERIALWDNYKFILIFLVVLGHMSDAIISNLSYTTTERVLFLFIYTFHMPMFLFVAGIFYSEKDLKAKVLFYLCSGFLLKICMFLVYYLFDEKTPAFHLLSDASIPWFMFTLAIFTAMTRMIRNTNKVFILVLNILIACFAGYDKSIGDFLYLSRVIVYYPFFLAGTMFGAGATDTVMRLKKNKAIIAASLSILIIWFVVCCMYFEWLYLYRHLLTGRNPYKDAIAAYGPIARLICYIMASAVGFSLLILTPSRRIPLITSWGGKTMSVYFWHLIILRAFVLSFSITYLFRRFGPGFGPVFLLSSIPFTVLLSCVPVFDQPLKYIKSACFRKSGK